MRKTIKLAGWYGIGTREVEVTAEASRVGVNVRAYLPPADAMELGGESANRLLRWDEVENDEETICRVGRELAGEVVRAALPTKPAGVTYSA